ncbi:signal transduction protein [Rhodospirillum rubrum]|uniref:tricarballylate utilization 4Fe-4S protein TcuB n=2 Tax=Rhodospirillum rubrum TaxID=1085 RepID=UPI0019044854|nr:tricarballylate utilization 4Fe-4S protein TcuB [Rhodospirillum rubrum]MBK1678126.1 signal transduction protein [Rhodospirillum rubrum]
MFDPCDLPPPPAPVPGASAAEARRVLALCTVCGYCTGLCDVFRAAERRPALASGDLAHLAHLCHGCQACWHACQYTPPHVFAIVVPATLARVRAESYAHHAWPRPLKGPAVLALALAATLVVPLLTVLLVPAQDLFAANAAPGAFYGVIPWGVMAPIALLTLGWAVLAVGLGVARFWREGAQGPPAAPLARVWGRALADIISLRNLKGGGRGCFETDDRPSHRRRWLHHALAGGFLLCLGSTLAATVYHHGLGREAPYPLTSLPVMLGLVGGGLMVGGASGLAWLKRHADPEPQAAETLGADRCLLAMLIAVALSGLLLLALRDTAAMGLLLALHLGTVLGFFITLPYGKFVHGAYRAAALLRAAAERRTDPRAPLAERPGVDRDLP